MWRRHLEDMLEPHDVPRAVSSVSMELVTDGWEMEPHAHQKAQLILTLRGVVTCEVQKGMWIVPSQCALWIPGGMSHSVRGVGELTLYCLFISSDLAAALPSECCTVAISPLLRELVIAVSRLPQLYDRNGPAAPLIRTMLNELASAPIERLHLPMPGDARLRKIADAMAADPSDRRSIGEWARRVAMSERSLSRLIVRETGMTFVRWRQQFQIMVALERLAQHEAVQNIALDLGYESASAFITMFRKTLGQPPGKYFAGRNADMSPY